MCGRERDGDAMISKTLATIAVAMLVLVSGVAAAGAAAPTDAYANENPDNPAGPDETPDGPADTPDNESDERVPDVAALDNESSERGNADNVSVGPPGGLPDQVPDHVSQIHDAIESFLAGDIGNLGETIQSIVTDNSEGDEDEESEEDESEDAEEDDADEAEDAEDDEQDEDESETETEDDDDDTDGNDAGPPEDTPGNAPR